MISDSDKYKRFFWWNLAGTAIIALVVVTISIATDPFGLFRDPTGRRLPVYTSERFTKYLFSYRYIPSKFNGVLIGPSFSDHINPALLEPFKIYNASLNGATIFEIKALAEKLFSSGKIHFVIICLTDYITKADSSKTNDIGPRSFFSALGSINMLYILKAYLSNKILHTPCYNDALGYNIDPQPPLDPQKLFEKIRKNRQALSRLIVKEKAIRDLKKLIQSAHRHRVQVFAYFHPYPEPHLALIKDKYEQYKKRIKALFAPQDVVIDMTNNDRQDFRKDLQNYHDWSHLSNKGSAFVAKTLKKMLMDHIPQSNKR